MKRKRIMIAGPARSGKSALANFLNGEERPLKRTLDTSYRQRTLEVPSAYLENTWMYQHLIALAQDAWCILVLVDQENPQPLYSPGFCADLSLSGGGRHQQMRSATGKIERSSSASWQRSASRLRILP